MKMKMAMTMTREKSLKIFTLTGIYLITVFCFTLISALPGVGSELPRKLSEPESLSRTLLEKYGSVRDYTAVMLKQERIDGALNDVETIELKFRKPGDIYMKWVGEPNKGQELIYRAGRNGNKIIAHRGGFWSFLSGKMEPLGSMAMKNQHHPVMMAGVGPTTKAVLKDLKKGVKNDDISSRYMGVVDLGGEKAYQIETLFPNPVKEASFTHIAKDGETLWDLAGLYDIAMYSIYLLNKDIDPSDELDAGTEVIIPEYYCTKSNVYISTETMMIVKIESYDQYGDLYEMYHYKDIRLNVGLSDMDFDTKNPAYEF
ncbi:MAG: DUF1571 domain-containing protein [Desulfobacteraceae bacterium]|nr:DUF1571 domain-containing protein [Desulfobacteraceae bacterium]